MKSIDLIKKLLRWYGILEFGSTSGEQVISIFLTCMVSTVFAIYFITTFLFFVFEAQTIDEYWECLFYMLCSMLVLSWYTTLFQQRANYNDLFDDLEAIVEKSKQNT